MTTVTELSVLTVAETLHPLAFVDFEVVAHANYTKIMCNSYMWSAQLSSS